MMTAQELNCRLAAGEDPLELSIEKWERVILNHYKASTYRTDYIGADNCGLCVAYAKTTPSCCEGCPLVKIEGGHCCTRNSLWRDVKRAVSSLDFLQAAIAMLEALKKCKTI